MTDSDKIFIDTNVLIYHSFKSLGFYNIAKSVLFEYNNLYFSRQVILEFINNFSNGKIIKIVNYEQVNKAINSFQKVIKLIDETNFKIDDLFAKIKKYDVKGRHIFDLKIYLDMKANNISKIITANEKDFLIFDDIKIINPFKVQ